MGKETGQRFSFFSSPRRSSCRRRPVRPGRSGRAGRSPGSYRSFSPFPILMYDTDIGFGYGGRVKFVDYLKKKESLDLILFNSTKGERWYVFTFSIPDLEIRQGKTYGLSFDLKAEYDKFLNYGFYGFGSGAPEEDLTILTFETINVPLTFGRGLSPHLVVEAGYTLRWIRYADPRDGPFVDEIAALAAMGRTFVPFVSFALKYDTSDSQIHPTRGLRLILQGDAAAKFLGSRDASFNRLTLDLRKYVRVFGEKDVFAVRALAQVVGGESIPLYRPRLARRRQRHDGPARLSSQPLPRQGQVPGQRRVPLPHLLAHRRQRLRRRRDRLAVARGDRSRRAGRGRRRGAPLLHARLRRPRRRRLERGGDGPLLQFRPRFLINSPLHGRKARRPPSKGRRGNLSA